MKELEQEEKSVPRLLFFAWLSFVWVFLLEFKFRSAWKLRQDSTPSTEADLTNPFGDNLDGLLWVILLVFVISFLLGTVLLLSAPIWWKKWPDAERRPVGSTLLGVFTVYFLWDLAMLVVGSTFPAVLEAPKVVMLWLTQGGGYLLAVSLFRSEAMRLDYRPTLHSTALAVMGYWMCFPLVMGGAFLLSFALGRPPVSGNPMMDAIMGSDPGTFAALAVLAVVVAPLFEEFLFRGIIYSQLSQSFGPWKAAFISAFLFAVVHVDIMATLPLFLLGVMFARLYEKTGTIWASFLCHLLWNLGTVLVLSALS